SSERGSLTSSPLCRTPAIARSRQGPGASYKSGSRAMSVISTPGRCSLSWPMIWPSGRTVKLAQRDGLVVLLLALIQKWFTAAQPGAEALVITIDDVAPGVDDVDAVVRLDAAGEAMGRAEQDPQFQAAGGGHHVARGGSQLVPVDRLVAENIDACIARQTRLG